MKEKKGKEIKRPYLGRVIVNNVYPKPDIGETTIDWVLDAEQGRELARFIAEACKQAVKFTLRTPNLTPESLENQTLSGVKLGVLSVALKPRKDGRFKLTVTYAIADKVRNPASIRAAASNPEVDEGAEKAADMLLKVARYFDGDWEGLIDHINEIKGNFPGRRNGQLVIRVFAGSTEMVEPRTLGRVSIRQLLLST